MCTPLEIINSYFPDHSYLHRTYLALGNVKLCNFVKLFPSVRGTSYTVLSILHVEYTSYFPAL